MRITSERNEAGRADISGPADRRDQRIAYATIGQQYATIGQQLVVTSVNPHRSIKPHQLHVAVMLRHRRHGPASQVISRSVLAGGWRKATHGDPGNLP